MFSKYLKIIQPFLRCRHRHSCNIPISISKTVQEALANKNPVVALESAVITHGMPWPQNYETAKDMQDIIISKGVVPATIGVFNGQIKVGFSNSELEEFSLSILKEKPVKVSRHNIYNYQNMTYGGTTVAGTMIIAKLVGIDVFATGGIGGVHKDVEKTMDISADLRELGRTKLCVVSSGVKSFLDIKKTLEYLETEGVFVCTLGAKEFPGFFVKSGGITSPNKIDSPAAVAERIRVMDSLNINSGMLVAVPIPDGLEQDGEYVQKAVETIQKEFLGSSVSSSNVTPFVLNKILEMTNGKSLILNMRLIKNNAAVASEIAKEFSELKKRKTDNGAKQETSNKSFAVIGASIFDMNSKFVDSAVTDLQTIVQRGTYECRTNETCGGVGRNMAEAFAKFDGNCLFFSVLGNDMKANYIIDHSEPLDFRYVLRDSTKESSTCSVVILSNNDILFHTANLSLMKQITPDYLQKYFAEKLDKIDVLCLDSNVELDAMKYAIEMAKSKNITVLLEPTDVRLVHKGVKVIRDLQPTVKQPIDIISPNIYEFFEFVKLLGRNSNKADVKVERNPEETFEFIKTEFVKQNLLHLIPIWIIKFNRFGVIFVSNDDVFWLKQSESLIDGDSIVNPSGAGDCLLACAIYLRFRQKLSWQDSIAGSIRIALESLKSHRTVPNLIDSDHFSRKQISNWIQETFDRNLISLKR